MNMTAKRLIAQLVEELNKLNPVESKLQTLSKTGLLKPVMTLAEILEHQEILMSAHENDSDELEETERAVQKCLNLPPVPLEKLVPLGF